MVWQRSFGAVRSFSTSAWRRGGGAADLGHLPPPGHNLPFDISNRYKFTLVFALYLGSGLSVPFLAIRHQMLKK